MMRMEHDVFQIDCYTNQEDLSIQYSLPVIFSCLFSALRLDLKLKPKANMLGSIEFDVRSLILSIKSALGNPTKFFSPVKLDTLCFCKYCEKIKRELTERVY